MEPFYANSALSTSGLWVSGGPMTFTASYSYSVFYSTSTPTQGSYLVQFSNPIVTSQPYTPKSAVAFPTQSSLLAAALDETAISSSAGVLFISTNNGQLLKYRYSDPGGSTTLSVTTPNYNSDTQVSSANPAFSYQTYSKTTQVVYLSSSSSSGGIWRVPFYYCSAATTCSSCAALNDPYCGWCPLGGICTTNTSCPTGEAPPLLNTVFIRGQFLENIFIPPITIGLLIFHSSFFFLCLCALCRRLTFLSLFGTGHYFTVSCEMMACCCLSPGGVATNPLTTSPPRPKTAHIAPASLGFRCSPYLSCSLQLSRFSVERMDPVSDV
jgi:hypothetical protein